MAKKKSGASPKYPAKNVPLNQAAKKAAQPTKLGNNYGKDGLNPIERGGK